MRNRLQRVIIMRCLLALAAASPVCALTIPKNPADAVPMLAMGILDSVLWNRIAPYYDNPISVPEGELYVLADIIPEHSPDLPSFGDVQKYAPWSARSIRRFLSDYPFLADVSPILSFDTTRFSPLGSVRFTLPRQTVTVTCAPTVSFSAEPVKGFGAQARLISDTTGISWGRRLVFATVPGGGVVSAGNVHPELNDGLFLGYFPSAKGADHLSPSRAWLLGTTASWNGALWSAAWGKTARTEVWYHQRQTERAAVMQTNLSIAPGVRLGAGISRLSMDTGMSALVATYAVHGGAEVKQKGWFARARACVASDGGGTVPFTWIAGHELDETRLSAGGMFIPARFPGGRSPLVHSVAVLTGNDSLRCDAMVVGMDVTRPVAGSMSAATSLSYTHMRGNSGGRAMIVLTGAAPFTHRVSYSCISKLRGMEPAIVTHDASAACSLGIVSAVGANVDVSTSFINSTPNVRGRLTVPVRIGEYLGVAPYVQGYAGKRTGSAFLAGIRQELYLGRQVNGVCTVELPCTPFASELVTVAVKCSFLL